MEATAAFDSTLTFEYIENMKRLLFKSGFFLFILLTGFLLMSCVSFDSDMEGTSGQVYEVEGVKVLLEPAVDTQVAIAVRNDNKHAVEVSLRGIGGEIGNDIYSSGGSNFAMKGNSTTSAAWLNDPASALLAPGEETQMIVRLNNWHKANKSFRRVRIDVRIIEGELKHRLAIVITENDLFTDPATMFQDNKLGKYDPSRYGARHSSIGNLPYDYELTIPD